MHPSRRRRNHGGHRTTSGVEVVPAWKWKAAGTIATIVQLAAVLSLLRLILPEDSWFTDVADGIGYFFGLPIDGNLFIALVFFLLGAALRRHKRAAFWALLLFQLSGLLLVGFIMVILVLAPEEVLDEGEHPHWVFLGAGFATSVLFVVLLWIVREGFPARLARGAWRRALTSFVLGMIALVL